MVLGLPLISLLRLLLPFCSVHVRRTDKVGTEAAFHGIEEYMTAVDDYYDQLELTEKVDKRRVFVASDDPKVSTGTVIAWNQHD